MTGTVTFAATQMACSWETGENVDRAEGLVREAAARGAQVVLLQELSTMTCPDAGVHPGASGHRYSALMLRPVTDRSVRAC